MLRFISVAQSLPKSSNVKMVDIWMIFSLMIPFVEVILQVALDYIRRREGSEKKGHVGVGRKKSERLDKIFKIILPGVIFIFQVSFWSCALTKSYADFKATHGQC